MFEDLIDFPIESPKLKWEAAEVVRDIRGPPHVLLRVRLTGTYFPRRAAEPFVSIHGVRSWHVRIDVDGLRADAFFNRWPGKAGRVEFGYGRKTLLRFPTPFDPAAVARLDRSRLPSAIREPK